SPLRSYPLCPLPVRFALLFLSHCPPRTSIYTLSLHDALPIWLIFPIVLLFQYRQTLSPPIRALLRFPFALRHSESMRNVVRKYRSEEHTSELQSRFDLVCRLRLEKKQLAVHPVIPKVDRRAPP